MRAIPTVGAVLLRDGKVLLIRHGEKAGQLTGVYGLPGGKVELGETHLQTAVRECKEETGLDVLESDMIELPEKYQATFERKDGINTFSFTVFLCRSFQGEIVSSEETHPL
jgi:8-oxo-dGTP diphosphatase